MSLTLRILEKNKYNNNQFIGLIWGIGDYSSAKELAAITLASERGRILFQDRFINLS